MRAYSINTARAREIRALRRDLWIQNQTQPETLTPVPKELWPRNPVSFQSNRAFVWRSKHFLVQGFQEQQDIIRLSICRADIDDNGKWKEGLTWDELQRVKRECGYADRDAVEIFPKESDVVNVANLRHLWVLPTEINFKWRNEVPVKSVEIQ